MSKYETKPGEGTIFGRERKTERHPIMGGQIVCPSCECELNVSMWPVTDKETGEPRRTREGKPFYNVKSEPAEGSEPKSKGSDTKQEEAGDDGLPF